MDERHGDDGGHTSACNRLQKSGHVALSSNGGSGGNSGGSGGSESWGWDDKAEGGEHHGEAWSSLHLTRTEVHEGLIEVAQQSSIRCGGSTGDNGRLLGTCDVTLEMVGDHNWFILHFLHFKGDLWLLLDHSGGLNGSSCNGLLG